MAVKAYQTALKQRTGAAAFAAIARVKSIKPPKVGAKEIDITTLESADEFEEYLAGLANGGELEATVEYDKTKTTTLHGLFRVSADYRIVYPDTSGWQMAGFINEYGDEEIVNGEIVTTTLKVKVTGKPTHFTAEV